eukprot:TRINITY_DN31079_c0_g1_i1.p1 TRINITY_DN31079_c0_g1~~TRINITY_DN31079_c0_g1_i1.p1  ORF type:complete len:554 (-),score=73.48 TRINITY_DN31079_c0_g1_i1:519-2180(-)
MALLAASPTDLPSGRAFGYANAPQSARGEAFSSSFGALSSGGQLSARFNYPRSRNEGGAGGRSASSRPASASQSRPGSGTSGNLHLADGFDKFRGRTCPAQDDIKENVFDKSTVDPFRHDTRYMASHISIAPPEAKLELVPKDRRARPLPSSLRPAALDILERPLRCLDRSGKAPPGHPSDEFHNAAAARAPPQPVPVTTQKHETEFLETIERSLQDGQVDHSLWDQYAKRAEELLITMPMEKLLRVLKAFVLARYRGGSLYTHIGGELAKEIRNASSTRICQVFHWIGRAGLRDQTLMSLMGNETLMRLSDDFVIDMHVEVLNVHAKLEIRSPRFVTAALRDLSGLFHELGRDQCCAVSPLAVMSVFTDQARVAYLTRCAELGLGLPVRMTRPAVLRQFRLLEDCLRLDYHPTSLPNVVQLWLTNLKAEADAHDVLEPTPLSPTEEDMLRVLREMDVAVTPMLQDGLFTVHLVMGKTVIEVLDSYCDYYVTPAMGGQRLLRAETKLRHRLLWRRGWRLLTLDEEDWTKLTDDIYKKDLLEDLLVNGPRRFRF